VARGYTPLTGNRAKALRHDPTDAERALWLILRDRRFEGFKFRRQQPIGVFIVDFVCMTARMIIEADGSQHAGSTYDFERTAWLQAQGYLVLRFWNNDILERREQVIAAIDTALTSPHPAAASAASRPLPQGERGARTINA